jgi:hypothetical protein
VTKNGMHDSQLIKILSSLTEKELKDFGKYVHSPFFIKRKGAAGLFEALKKFYPDFEKNLTKEKLYKKAFPGRDYNDSSMRKLISELLRLSKDFLAYLNYSDKPFTSQLHLANELNFRGINTNNIFKNTINKALHSLDNEKRRDEDYYLSRFLIEQERNLAFSDLKRDSFKRNWQSAFNNMVYFSLMSMLNYYHFLNQNMKQTNVYYKLDLLDEVISFLDNNKAYINKTPVIAIYYYQLKAALDENNTSYFFELKKLADKYGYMFGKVYEANIYVGLFNYSTIKADAGYTKFNKIRFDILKKMFSKKLCHENGLKGRYVIPGQFSWMVLSASELGKFKYAESFIDTYKNKLYPPLKRGTLEISYAVLNLYEKNYDKALKHLSGLNYENFFDKMKVKALTLMIYYEQGLTEESFSLIDTFKHFLSSYKLLSTYTKERYSSFVRIVNKLIKIKNGKANITPEELKIEMRKIRPVVHRLWLEEKIGELGV